MVVRRALILAVAVAVATLGLTVLAGSSADRPVAVVGHTGPPMGEVTTTAPVPTTAEVPPATVANTKVAVANRSSTVVRSDSGGVRVVNEGSAVASTGGNTVIGPPDASVSNGPVTAVGNSSEVRITRR